MFIIMKRQILEGLMDSKYLFMALVTILAFLVNSFVYSERYHQQVEDYQENRAEINDRLESLSDNLQKVSNYPQKMMLFPNPYLFISDGGQQVLPNVIQVNAFQTNSPDTETRDNDMLPVIMPLDWSFIVGILMTLMSLMVSFNVICGEKREGTLRLVLSNPISRRDIFLGKYLGLLTIVILTFFVGAAINICILCFNGALELNGGALFAIGWAFLLSTLCLSFVLLLGIAVSSLVKTPSIAMVILLVGWIINIAAIPGLARIIGEKLVETRPDNIVKDEYHRAEKELRDSISAEALQFSENPFDPAVAERAKFMKGCVEILQTLNDESNKERIDQIKMINILSSIGPSGLLKYTLQEGCKTGVYSFEVLLEKARLYRDQLNEFTTGKDRKDKSSPHLIASWGVYSEPGLFSQQKIEISSLPSIDTLWRYDRKQLGEHFPLWQLMIFILGNLQIGLLAFIFVTKYDPR